MVVELDPKYERQLKAIAETTGKTVTEIVEGAVQRVIQEQVVPGAGQMSSAKKEEMLARFDELRKLATAEPPDDGWTSDDHDKVIYRTSP